MATYYMATNGVNGAAGTIGAPWKTLAYSSGRLVAGDTLYIRVGTYTDRAFNFGPCVGTISNRILISAYPVGGTGPGYESVIFDGGSTAVNFFNSGNSNGSSSYTTIQGIKVQNYGILGGAASGSGMWFGSNGGILSKGIKIKDCTMIAIGSAPTFDHAIYFSHGCQSAEVANCIFMRPSGCCIQMAHAPGMQTGYYHDNLFFQGRWGVLTEDGCSAISVTNNVFVGQTIGGVDTHFDGEKDNPAFPAVGTFNLYVASNIFRGCATAIVPSSFDFGTPKWEANLFFGNTSIGKTGTSAVKLDPLFVNYQVNGTGDYHLQAGSPAIGAGTSTFASALDFSYNARPSGGGFDIGAYQFTVGTPDTTAPILSSPTGTKTGITTADGTVSTNEANGTLKCWTTTNSTETVANTKTNGTAQTITSTGVKTFHITGLAASTTYYNHYAHTDAAGNDSLISNSASFTTDASGSATIVYFDLPNVTNGSGTSASPKNQTGWAAQTKTPGDTYLFKRGTTSAANAFTLTSGTVGNLIKWGAWYNADGSDDITKALPILTTTTVLSAFNGTNNNYVWLDSVSIRSSGIAVANDKALMWAGTGSVISNSVFDSNCGTLGIWADSDVTITDSTFYGVSHSSANNNCVLLVSSTNMTDITITGCTFKHYGGGGTTSHNCRIEADSGNTLNNLIFQHNTIVPQTGVANANLYAIGLRLSNCPGASIDYNSITYHLEGIFASATNAATIYNISHNTCSNNAHYGIHLSTYAIGCILDANTCSFNGTSTNNGASLFAYGRGIECSSAAGQDRCSGHTIRYNVCNNNVNYGGPLDNGSEGVGIGLDDGTTNCLLYGNTCKDNEGNGIQQYGGVTGSGTPAISDTGGNAIIANYLENNCTAAIHNRQTGGTDTTLFNAHIALANSFGTTAYIAHNVCVTTTPCGISINASCDDLIIANNIMTSAHGIAMDAVYSASVGVCNSNDFFGVGQKYCLRSVNVSGSATFAASTYTGTNDLTTDPKWTAAHSLSAGSNAIHAGFYIGTRLDFLGREFKNPPSLGMLEDFVNPFNVGGHLHRKIYHKH